jgi:hypothetical protein
MRRIPQTLRRIPQNFAPDTQEAAVLDDKKNYG